MEDFYDDFVQDCFDDDFDIDVLDDVDQLLGIDTRNLDEL